MEEYHDCLNMSDIVCLIKLYGIVISNCWTHILLNPILSKIFLSDRPSLIQYMFYHYQYNFSA